jgi:hypothetical protein
MRTRHGGAYGPAARWVIAALALGMIAGARPLHAQQEPMGEIPAPKPAISLLLINQPVVTVNYAGDYGPMRVTGTLMEAPQRLVKIIAANGDTRMIGWNEIFSLALVTVPTAELPIGSYTIVLSSEESALPRTSATLTTSYTPGVAVAAIPGVPTHVAELPRGEVVLEGSPYGAMRIPTSRISEMHQEAVRGSLILMPEATLSLEVRAARPGEGGGNGKGAPGGRRQERPEARGEPVDAKVVDIPLRRVEVLRRDVANQTASVSLDDGQIFTGRVIRLPDVAIQVQVEGETMTRSYPLARIAQFETSVPLISRPALTPR